MAAASSGAAVIFSNLAQPEVAFDREAKESSSVPARRMLLKRREVMTSSAGSSSFTRSFLPVMRVREREKTEEERRQRGLV
jgi:hypothetical protein